MRLCNMYYDRVNVPDNLTTEELNKIIEEEKERIKGMKWTPELMEESLED